MGTVNNNFLPNSTGLDLGSSGQRWDINAQDIDASRNVTVGGTLTVTGDVIGTIRQQAGGSHDLEVNQTITTTGPNGQFPLGGDLVLWSRGPSDLWLKHDAAKTTTTTSLSIGANNNVSVGSTESLSGSAGIIIGRGTPNEEAIGSSSFTIVDATHINVTCTKAHTIGNANNSSKSTIDIEQGMGNTMFQVDGGGGIWFDNVDPAQLPDTYEMVRLVSGRNGVAFVLVPSSSVATFPRNAVNFIAPITGSSGVGGTGGPLPAAADLIIKNASAAVATRLQNAAGDSVFVVQDANSLLGKPLVSGVTGGTASSYGTVRLLTGDSIYFRNNANSGDVRGIEKDSSDVVYVGGTAGIRIAGTITNYNGAATVSQGVPPIVAQVNAVNQAAAITSTNLLASVGAGIYRVTYVHEITQAATTSSATQLTIGWNNGYSAQTKTGTNLTGNTLTTFDQGSFLINAAAATNITYAATYSSTGATVMQFGLAIRLEKL